VGEIENPSGVGDVVNQVCLDRMRLTIRLDGEKLVDAKIKAKGCPPSLAAASVLTELIIGRTIDELEAMTREDIAGALGRLPPAKMHCAVLAIAALRAALEDSRGLSG
jgi:nitrogen fixation NifU-like protein